MRDLLAGFVVGVVSSLVAAFIWPFIENARMRRRIRIEGVWGEYITDARGHQYSCVRVYFDKWRKMYAFDGTNYKNNGSRYCHWRTVSGYLDERSRKYFYIFAIELAEDPNTTRHGFGVINLTQDAEGLLVPTDGHYVSADIDGTTYTMHRLDNFKYAREDSGQNLIERLKRIVPK
jgi:hypothetical protein